MLNKHCIVCGQSVFIEIYNKTLLKCSSCGFVTANLLVSDHDLKNIYSENYFKGEEYLDYLKEKNALKKNFKKRLKKIISIIPQQEMSSVLEIGCAYGFFAEIFTKKFPFATYKGIDIVEHAIEYGQKQLNQNLVCINYLNYQPSKTVSDVFMWDVIEHLSQPDIYMKKIYSELEDKGRLYITTGDIDRLVPRLQKNKWRLIHPPTHLHYFSKKTMTLFLKQHGFNILSVSYPPIYRSMKQIFYSLCILNKKPNKLLSHIYSCLPENLNIPFNTFDIMFIIAQKSK